MAKLAAHPGRLLYMLFMLSLCTLILATPLLAAAGSASLSDPLYYIFSFTCHQLTERSLCIFPSTGGISVSDCGEASNPKSTTVQANNITGYKLPVCSRDLAIYFSMLLGGILVLLLGRSASLDWPSPWLLAAFLIPIALDGGTQLASQLIAPGLHSQLTGSLLPRESTNFLRLLTGSLAGVIIPFYLVPMLNRAISSLLETR